MIHIVFGAPGMGKSSLQTYFAKELFQKHGRAIWRNTCAQIDRINAQGYRFSYPNRAPIFTDFAMEFKAGYGKRYRTYFTNGYYMGFQNPDVDVKYTPPGSVVFLSEAQRYYYSRQSKSFPTWVSRYYEMHRHFGLEIYMDVQRSTLIDLNIRELCKHFIEVVSMEHTYNAYGVVTSTTWHCREWINSASVAEYLASSETVNYTETTYTNEGNIFECYDSRAYFENFIPPKDKDFDYYEHADIVAKRKDQEFYNITEPAKFRGGGKKAA